MSKPVPILIITGYGLNCEAESAFAWQQAGAAPKCVHLNDLLERPAQLHDFAALMFIGGFSYGDHMGSGLVFAHRLRHHIRDELQKFIADGNADPKRRPIARPPCTRQERGTARSCVQ